MSACDDRTPGSADGWPDSTDVVIPYALASLDLDDFPRDARAYDSPADFPAWTDIPVPVVPREMGGSDEND